ncbi:putative salutaridinol 7-O-acetyltransferase [Rosa chinensis]|uniref:Putative salutaridinol 7-O-acetyltransferase n=1 Tax=Rosa chinensis TaxID=74649 RepID=A0A2P6R0Q0_ROSCH|nr:acyltransferase Pun1 [Rosa chinensis]PRQ40011.1 putative salutaridinol 7-O-acetyltransferase [Rosa chinensis]
MTSMEVKIISRETIKPSTPTLSHHGTYHLSFLEQINPRTYTPVVYFYPKEESDSDHNPNFGDKSNQLKRSLSEILAKYYPFSGRIRDRVSIDCNDEGVIFVEARIKVKLSEILEHPKDEVLDLLFTDNLQWNDDSNLTVILAIQVSFFDCGGMAIGICMSHKVADTCTMINFINDWAAITRDHKADQYVSPEFIAATVFPQGEIPLLPQSVIEKGDYVSKRFVFAAPKVAALKAMVCDKVQNPSKVEVVTAFIHRCAISALKSNSGSLLNPSTLLIQTVNLRGRMVPPLPKSSVGSMVWFYAVPTAEDESVIELHDLVSQMKERMAHFCVTYAEKFGKEWPLIFMECMKDSRKLFQKQNLVVYRCSSWCRFPVYEADFGWGKPIWVTIASCVMKNSIFLIDTRNGEGIEAHVNLEKQHMDVFARDAELLAFASLNPSANIDYNM